MPHLEIAAIFLAHCTNYFLKEDGKLAFVLPRSFFSADHHDATRSGKANNVRIIDIWDLDQVSPLFNVPSCVLWTERPRANLQRSIPKTGRNGSNFKGRLKQHNLNWNTAKEKIEIENKKFYYSKLGNTSAFTTFKLKDSNKTNYYRKYFKQGATIVPRNFYFIDVTQDYAGDLKDRVLTVKSSESMNAQAKMPWKAIEPLEGRIDTNYLFRTAISRNVLPFYMHNPELIILPVYVDSEQNFRMLSSQNILDRGDIDTAKWFREVEKLWDENKTPKNKNITARQWLDWQSKLTQQNYSAKYIVIYTASAKDANATVIKRDEIYLDFIAESKTYCYFTNNSDEAFYICAFLNAKEPNDLIKSFQTRGLFGPRDIHKKILDVPLPRFKKNDITHLELAELGKTCEEKTKNYIKTLNLPPILSTRDLGRARLDIRKHLEQELKQIDTTIRKIVRDKEH